MGRGDLTDKGWGSGRGFVPHNHVRAGLGELHQRGPFLGVGIESPPQLGCCPVGGVQAVDGFGRRQPAGGVPVGLTAVRPGSCRGRKPRGRRPRLASSYSPRWKLVRTVPSRAGCNGPESRRARPAGFLASSIPWRETRRKASFWVRSRASRARDSSHDQAPPACREAYARAAVEPTMLFS